MGPPAAARRLPGLVRPLLAGFILLVAGCDETILHELSEGEANEIQVVLDGYGIVAKKVPAKGESKKGLLFDISVDGADVVRARRALYENKLPRPKVAGYEEIFKTPSLNPTATEERARELIAKQGELTNAIMAITGVIEAKVNLVLPDPGSLDPTGRPAEARSSVLVKYRERDASELPQSEAEKKKFEEEAYKDTLLALMTDMKRLDLALRQLGQSQAKRREKVDDLVRLLGATGSDPAAKAEEAYRTSKAIEKLMGEEDQVHESIRQIKRVRDIDKELARLGEVERRSLPFTEDQIKTIVSGGVRNLNPENVSVTINKVPTQRVVLPAQSGTGAGVDRRMFLAALGGIAALALVLVGLAVWVLSLKKQVAAAKAGLGTSIATSSSGGGA